MKKRLLPLKFPWALILTLAVLMANGTYAQQPVIQQVLGEEARPSLKEAYKDRFLIGVAMNEAQFTEKDAVGAGLIKSDFNTITPENVMKWQEIHPEENRYDFTAADQYVEFGNKNGMFVIGHTFAWHYFTPPWLFKGAKGARVDRDTLL
jgi:endo-1,4-beta-xylanase